MVNLKDLEKEVLEKVYSANTAADLESSRIKYLGRKSELMLFLRNLKSLPEKERVILGSLANNLKNKIGAEIDSRNLEIERLKSEQKTVGERVDISAPGKKLSSGHLHPLTLVQREVARIFNSMGFTIIEGPEIETEWYNFDVLNVPADHPARDMQDTFWLKQSEIRTKDPKKHLLPRTHTSAMQVRYMEKSQPPFRIIVPGRVFRNEATDATHEVQFYTFEGLMVGRNVSLANLKGVLEFFAKQFFKDNVQIRFVSSYFPYTEPSVEVFMKGSKGKLGDHWIEIAGAGMVNQKVFKSAGYVPGEYQGFAFGMSLDRLTIFKYGIDDIRLLYNNDIRFLEQF